MEEYIIEIKLPDLFTEEFTSKIPRQRAIVNKLMNDGIVTSYALSLENSKLWVTLLSENVASVKKILSTFPIINFITYKINKLTFHNSINFKLPSFSLN